MIPATKSATSEAYDLDAHSLKQFTWFNLVVWLVIEGAVRISQNITYGKPTVYFLIDISDTLSGFLICFAIRPILGRYVRKISVKTVVVAFVSSLLAAIVWQVIHTELYITIFPQEPRAESFLQGLKGLRLPFYLFLVWCAAFAFWQNNVWVTSEQKRRLQAEKTGKQAVLRNLQSQLAPHFVFNSLNAAYAMAIEEGAVKTQEQLLTMANLIRHSTNASGSIYSTWGAERDFIEDYLALEKSRFDQRLELSMNIDPTISEAFRIPTLLLQPLFENVITHSVARSIAPVRLTFTATKKPDGVWFTVHNNLPEKRKEDSADSLGSSIINLKKRLEVLYAGKAKCRIEDALDHYEIAVFIPAKSKEE